jgi:hypothetical protein
MPETTITLTEEQAEDLRELLDHTQIIEDWLLHAGEEVLAELADFAFPTHFHPASAVTWLTEDIGQLGCRLRQALSPHVDHEINTPAAASDAETVTEASTSNPASPATVLTSHLL